MVELSHAYIKNVYTPRIYTRGYEKKTGKTRSGLWRAHKTWHIIIIIIIVILKRIVLPAIYFKDVTNNQIIKSIKKIDGFEIIIPLDNMSVYYNLRITECQSSKTVNRGTGGKSVGDPHLLQKSNL